MFLWPREAGKFIASKSIDVTINHDGIQRVADIITQSIKDGTLDMDKMGEEEMLPKRKKLSNIQKVEWIFLIDALNFNFWTPDEEPKFSVVYKDKYVAGYLAMVAAINRAIDEGKKMYDPTYYSKLTPDEVKHILRSDSPSQVPLLHERVRVMREVGSILISKFGGSFVNLLGRAEGSAMKLVNIVVNEFPCFYDVAEFEGQKVALFKRAQILAADLWLLFHGKSFGSFSDIDQLTMFADYRVPQSLAYFGALQYSANLWERMLKEEVLKCGDREEVEIRGCSIHAVELVVEKTRQMLMDWGTEPSTINSMMIDYFLWNFRVKNAVRLESIPYHRVRCIFY